LIADLRTSLNDAANVFADDDTDFIRHLDYAAEDFSRARPRIIEATLNLIADQSLYAAPFGFVRPHALRWGDGKRRDIKPWEVGYTGRLPRLRMSGDPDARAIIFSPSPSASQIAILGSSCVIEYIASHVIDPVAANTTVQSGDRGLLLLRAQAEAAKEMAMRNMHKPVRMRDGISGGTLNGTPSALFKQLMDQFDKQAMR